jgi:hypothetical protein
MGAAPLHFLRGSSMKYRYLAIFFAASSGLILTSFAEVNFKNARLVNKAAYIPALKCMVKSTESDHFFLPASLRPVSRYRGSVRAFLSTG